MQGVSAVEMSIPNEPHCVHLDKDGRNDDLNGAGGLVPVVWEGPCLQVSVLEENPFGGEKTKEERVGSNMELCRH